jgi:hypothetical protein
VGSAVIESQAVQAVKRSLGERIEEELERLGVQVDEVQEISLT